MAIPLGRLLLIIAVLMQAVGPRQAQFGSVKGAVHTGAGPVEGVRVAVEPVDNTPGAGVLESIGLTEKDGTFLLENVTPGRYHVVFGRIGAPVYHPGVTNKNEATTILVVAGATTTVPEMISKTTSVSGTVIDLKTGQGRRIQSLVLCCEFDMLAPSAAPTAASSFRFFTTPSRPMTAAVRDDGTFSFPAVVPGEYYLQAVDPAIVPTAQAIVVAAAGLNGVEMKVTNGVAVEGRIVDRLNQPVASVNVALKPSPGNPMVEARSAPVGSSNSFIMSTQPIASNSLIPHLVTEPKVRMVTATAEGTFTLPGVLPGKYALEMHAPGGNAYSRQVEIGVHESLTTTLEVPFTLLSGQIVVNDGSPLPKLTGSLRFVSTDPDGRIVFGFPDDTGRFSVLMTSGEYRIFTEALSVDRDIESISVGTTDLEDRRLTFDGSRRQEIRITIAP